MNYEDQPESKAVWTEEQYNRDDDDILADEEDADPRGQDGKTHYTNWYDA